MPEFTAVTHASFFSLSPAIRISAQGSRLRFAALIDGLVSSEISGLDKVKDFEVAVYYNGDGAVLMQDTVSAVHGFLTIQEHNDQIPVLFCSCRHSVSVSILHLFEYLLVIFSS